jgi:uncharacterized protein YbjQ (UPF0145 family)
MPPDITHCRKCNKEFKGGVFASQEDKRDVTYEDLCYECGVRVREQYGNNPVVDQVTKQKEMEGKARLIAVMSIEHIPSEMEVIGLVRGSTARANIVGGEVVAYTKLIADARDQALQRLKEDAAKLEADMVVGVRFTSTTIDTGISEILAYGTALKRIVDE